MTLPTRRVFVTGASGAGSTTLARALADKWSSAAHDTDDYFWMPSNPPYAVKRPLADRVALMEAVFLPRSDWVLSGSLMDWGAAVIPKIDLIVFLRVASDVRLGRLRDRETQRFGDEALAPGGAMYEEHTAFMAWAAGYDDPEFDGRNLARHQEWLSQTKRPVIELDSAMPVEELVAQVEAALSSGY